MMKKEILSLLKNTEDYVSGQELCERFSVSRTAVWKTIKRLKEEGYDIEAVQNRGYRLRKDADVLSAQELEEALQNSFVSGNIVYFDTTDSTNTQAKILAEQGAVHGTLVVADCQNAGKGRKGRGFDSPAGQSVYMSLLLRPDVLPNNASMLTLVAALAVEHGIWEVTKTKAKIKWPNDIILNGKKVCGILTETSMQEDGICHIIIGIGINVQNTSFPEEISDVATSLYLETGEKTNRVALIESILRAFEDYFARFCKTQDMSLLLEEYQALLINRGQKVRVLDPTDPYEGIAQGITKRGELLVDTDDGVKKVAYGEVSVRGVYGYV